MQGSLISLVKPSSLTRSSNLWFQHFGLCQRPYSDLCSLHTNFRRSSAETSIPSGISMKIWSCRSPCRNAVFTSKWYENHLYLLITTNATRTSGKWETGAYTSEKSYSLRSLYPQTTSRVCQWTLPSASILRLNTHLESSMVLPTGRGTRVQTWFLIIDSISSSYALFQDSASGIRIAS